MTGIDRVALARVIRATREFQATAAFGCPVDAHEQCAQGIADAVIDHLAAAGPRDAGLRERIEALTVKAEQLGQERHGEPLGYVPTASIRAALAAPDPGPDPGDGSRDRAAAVLMGRWGVEDDDQDAYDAACADWDALIKAGLVPAPAREAEGER